MKNLTSLVLSLGILGGCATLNEREMYCYKYGDCTQTFPITSSVINLEYSKGGRGKNNGVYIEDKFNGTVYRVVRRNDGYDSLELEMQEQEFTVDDMEVRRNIILSNLN